MTWTQLAVVLWLLLGVASDLLYGIEARKRGDPYPGAALVLCYLVGPILLPLAFAYGAWQTLRRR